MYMHCNYYIHEQEQYTSFLVFKKDFIIKKKKLHFVFLEINVNSFNPTHQTLQQYKLLWIIL